MSSLQQAFDLLSTIDEYAVVEVLRNAPVEVVATGLQVVQSDGKLVIHIGEKESQADPADIALVLFHEVIHHTYRSVPPPAGIDPNDPLWVLSENVVVNKTMVAVAPHVANRLCDYYLPDVFPECLLRPNSRPPSVSAARLYRALYRDEVSQFELYQYLSQLDGDEADVGEEIGDEIGGGAEMSAGGAMEVEALGGLLPTPPEQTSDVTEAFHESLVSLHTQTIFSRLGDELREEIRRQTFQPVDIQRPDLIALMAGLDPLLWRAPRISTQSASVSLYVDVSRSIRQYSEFIYECCVHFADLIDHSVKCFANDVTEVDIHALHDGLPFGKGTDFSPPLQHALHNGAERILFITDGKAPLDPQLAKEISRRRISVYAIFTPGSSSASLQPILQQYWELTHDDMNVS